VIKVINAPALRQEYIDKIRLLANECNVKIEIGQEIEVIGGWDAVSTAFVRICLILDELAGWSFEKFEIDSRYAIIIGGIEQQDIKQIMKDTCTQIYLPNPFKIKQGEPFHISGVPKSIKEAIERLSQLVRFKVALLLSS